MKHTYIHVIYNKKFVSDQAIIYKLSKIAIFMMLISHRKNIFSSKQFSYQNFLKMSSQNNKSFKTKLDKFVLGILECMY